MECYRIRSDSSAARPEAVYILECTKSDNVRRLPQTEALSSCVSHVKFSNSHDDLPSEARLSLSTLRTREASVRLRNPSSEL